MGVQNETNLQMGGALAQDRRNTCCSRQTAVMSYQPKGTNNKKKVLFSYYYYKYVAGND